MVTNRLIDTRLELLSGEAVVEADELLKDNGVTIVSKSYAVQLQKKGVYSFTSDPARLRVYDGEASVDLSGKTQEVKEGHALDLDGDLKVASFDKKDTDELYRWGAHRSEYISMANVSAAKMAADSGAYLPNSSWYYNPYYDMYTFMPGFGMGGFGYGGMFMNPFGYGFLTPYSVYPYLNSLPYYGGGYGGYAPVAGGTTPVHVHTPTQIPPGVTAAVAARQTMAAATHAHVSEAVASGGRGGFGSSSASSSSLATASHGSSMSMGGHAGGGGGGHK